MVKKSDFTSIGVRSFPTRGEEYEFVFEIVNLLLKIKFKGRGGGGREGEEWDRRPNFVIFVVWSAFFYLDSLHARLERHYKAWTYKKKKHKKIKA